MSLVVATKILSLCSFQSSVIEFCDHIFFISFFTPSTQVIFWFFRLLINPHISNALLPLSFRPRHTCPDQHGPFSLHLSSMFINKPFFKYLRSIFYPLSCSHKGISTYAPMPYPSSLSSSLRIFPLTLKLRCNHIISLILDIGSNHA